MKISVGACRRRVWARRCEKKTLHYGKSLSSARGGRVELSFAISTWQFIDQPAVFRTVPSAITCEDHEDCWFGEENTVDTEWKCCLETVVGGRDSVQEPTDRQAVDKSTTGSVCVSSTDMFDVPFRFILCHHGVVSLFFEDLSKEAP